MFVTYFIGNYSSNMQLISQVRKLIFSREQPLSVPPDFIIDNYFIYKPVLVLLKTELLLLYGFS